MVRRTLPVFFIRLQHLDASDRTAPRVTSQLRTVFVPSDERDDAKPATLRRASALSSETMSSTQPLSIYEVSVSEMDNRCYLLVAGESALLIDAADQPDTLIDLAREHHATIEAVVTTHRHWDHVRALEELLERTGATHYAPAPDADALPAKANVILDHGDKFDFAGHTMEAIILRGHTPGGLALAVSVDGTDHLFVGDSLFPGGVGKTNSREDFQQLLEDVSSRLFDRFSDDAVVHPGHGNGTTLGAERPKLPQWRERGW